MTPNDPELAYCCDGMRAAVGSRIIVFGDEVHHNPKHAHSWNLRLAECSESGLTIQRLCAIQHCPFCGAELA